MSSKQASSNKRTGTKPRAVRPKNRPRRTLEPLARLLANPCGAIPRNIALSTGGGIVRVVRVIIPLHSSATQNNGYVLWYPDFHCRGSRAAASATSANLFALETVGLTTPPGAPVVPGPASAALFGGVDPTAGVGASLADPAYGILGVTFREGATLAACAKFRYLGATGENRGAVGRIEQLDGTSFITTDGSNIYGPAPSALISFADDRQRPSMADLEVRWAPTSGFGSAFRGTGDMGANNVLNNESDSFLEVGVTGGPPSRFVDPAPSSHSAIGFVWNGLNPLVTGDIEVELIKVIELKLSPVSGLREAVAEVPSAEAFTRAVHSLDAEYAGWRTAAEDIGSRVLARGAATVANMALAGAATYARGNRGTMSL